MNCFSELTYSIYADGELLGEEARAVERHLAICARCRGLVTGLRAESQILREVLSEPDLEAARIPAWPPERPLRVAGPLLAVLAALAGLRIAVGALFDLDLPAGLDSALEWLNPFQLNTQLALFFRGVFFVAEEGASMLAVTFTVVGVLIVLVLVVFASLLLRRQGAQISATTLAISMLVAALAAPPRAAAVEVRKGEKMGTITIPAGQTINDSLIVTGETIIVDGTITGNLIAAGRSVRIRGTVQGDVVVGSQSLDLAGTVTGNVYAFSQNTNIRGQIRGSLHNFSQIFRLESVAAVDGDTLTFAADNTLEGAVARDVMAFSGMVEARGKIGRNLSAFADRVLVSSTGTVGGNLTARVPAQNRLTVDPAAKVSGKTDIQIRASRAGWQARLGQPRFYFWQAVQVAGAMIVGALLLTLFPGFYRSTAGAVTSWPRSLGLGFAALVAGPVAIVILAVTLIGIPLAAAGLFLYIAGLYLAKIITGAWLGQTLLRRMPQNNQDALLGLLLGLLIIFVVVQIPFVGGIFHMVLFCLGLGSFTWWLYVGRHTA